MCKAIHLIILMPGCWSFWWTWLILGLLLSAKWCILIFEWPPGLWERKDTCCPGTSRRGRIEENLGWTTAGQWTEHGLAGEMRCEINKRQMSLFQSVLSGHTWTENQPLWQINFPSDEQGPQSRPVLLLSPLLCIRLIDFQLQSAFQNFSDNHPSFLYHLCQRFPPLPITWLVTGLWFHPPRLIRPYMKHMCSNEAALALRSCIILGKCFPTCSHHFGRNHFREKCGKNWKLSDTGARIWSSAFVLFMSFLSTANEMVWRFMSM